MLPTHGYTFALNDSRLKRYFPKLIHGINFQFTSEKTDDYNCVAWATEIIDDWIQFIYDEQGNYDDDVKKYLYYFSELGYTITTNQELISGVQKLAVYIDHHNNFKHVARQLYTGKWTSKLGEWEDIEHSTLDVLIGESYGNHYIIMEKSKQYLVKI